MELKDHLRNLFELLSIPSISALPEHKKDMLKATKWLQKKLQKLGFNADVLPTKGHPVVYGELSSPTTNNLQPTTLLIYGHYDVQSPDPLEKWLSDPFKPEVRSGNIYGRGTADDKGQLYTWFAAIEELMTSNQRPKATIKFLIEGEEEVGSANLDEFVSQNKTLLKSDVCVITDSHSLGITRPLISYGLRGISYIDVKIKTLAHDVHSGTYGGNVLNPAIVLAQIISELKNEYGKILVPGFYDNVRKLGILERQKLKRLPFGEKQVMQETGAKVVVGEKGFSVHERAGARPTLEVNGIWGGYQGQGPKTIIPAEANAKISCRIVPNQTSREIYEKVEKYIRKLTPKGVEVEINLISDAEPAVMDINGKYFRLAEKALEKTFGNKPYYELSGGTIGSVATFKRELGIDSVMFGYGLPDDGLHAPNEKLSLAMFEKGIKNNIEFLKSF